MGKENKEQKTKVKRPRLAINLYDKDVEALGYNAETKNAEIRNAIREKLGLPKQVRHGINAEIKEILGLSADATVSEVKKAMQKKILEGN